MKTKTMMMLAAIGLVMSGSSALAQCYTGGVGACYAMDALTTPTNLGGPLVTLSSTDNQSFARGYAPVAISILTITDDPDTPGIISGTSIAVWIPAGFAMTWDATNVNAVIGGSAVDKVDATVSYTEANQRLLIAVTEDFLTSDTLTVSTLAFKDFLGSGSSRLELDYDNDGVADALDDKQITIDGVFAGGDGANYCLNQALLEKCLHPVGTLISIARLR